MTVTINGSSGITAPEVILDNTTADGGQVVLKSSGYSNWNLDNYSGRLRAYYGSTEYFTVTNSGNVGIGTSSPAKRLSVVNATDATTVGTNAVMSIQAGSSVNSVAEIGFSYGSWSGTNPIASLGYQITSNAGVGSGALTFSTRSVTTDTAPSERMRIDSSGNLLVGTTSAALSNGTGIKLLPGYSAQLGIVTNESSNNSHYHHYNTNATYNGYRFYTLTNGGIVNYSGNNQNLSDERSKKNIEVSGGYLDKICAIPVKLFNYKDEQDGEQRTLGVIAQDVEVVAPELVNFDGFGDTPEDGVPLKSIYTTDMMFALMKCIQEQQTLIQDQLVLITSLTARIEALENK